MELRHLRYFVTVVEEASFTRAAVRLHVAQPGVSAQIQQLERELGQPLLDRSGRTVTPTAVGLAVLEHARAALAAVDRVRHTVDEFTGLLRGRVAIGMISGAAPDDIDVATILAEFHRKHPHVEISLTEDSSDRMLAAVRRGALDVALVGLIGSEPPADLALEVVVDTALIAAVALDAEGPADEIALRELRERSLISLPRGTGIRSVLECVCAEAGFTPHVAFEGASPRLLIRLAARGLGIAVLPELPADEAAALGIRALRIVDPQPRAQLALIWRPDLAGGPAVAVVLRELRRGFSRAAGLDSGLDAVAGTS